MRKKKYTAPELFRIIMKYSYPKLASEKIKKGLLAKGKKETDIDMALRLMACIALINHFIFNDENPILNFCPNQNRFRHFAGHANATKNSQEAYHVFVIGLARAIEHEMEERVIMFCKRKPCYEDLPKLSLEEALLGIAMHEVRHRFQKKPGMKMFSRKSFSFARGELRKYLNYTKILFQEEKRIYLRDGKSKGLIRDRMKRTEFDAVLIETMGVNAIHKGISIEDLKSLITLQSE
jgi:hypothetical protein